MNAPSRSDLDVLEALDKGSDPASLPADAIERLAGFKLVTLRPPGRVMLTGTAKEVLLRREYGLPLPLAQDQQEPEQSLDDSEEEEEDDPNAPNNDDTPIDEAEAKAGEEPPRRH